MILKGVILGFTVNDKAVYYYNTRKMLRLLEPLKKKNGIIFLIDEIILLFCNPNTHMHTEREREVHGVYMQKRETRFITVVHYYKSLRLYLFL